jgi:hypothetical protein
VCRIRFTRCEIAQILVIALQIELTDLTEVCLEAHDVHGTAKRVLLVFGFGFNHRSLAEGSTNPLIARLASHGFITIAAPPLRQPFGGLSVWRSDMAGQSPALVCRSLGSQMVGRRR